MNWRSPRPLLRRHRGFTGSGGGGTGGGLLEPYFLIDANLGNDTTGDGAPNGVGTPWRTFGKAATEMSGSSTKRTYARTGTYSTAIGETFPRSLTASHANIEFRAYPNETPTIDGLNGTTRLFALSAAPGITFLGIKFINIANDTVFNDPGNRAAIFADSGSNDLIVEQCTFEDVFLGVSTQNSLRAKILDNIFRRTGIHGIQIWDGSDNAILAGNELFDIWTSSLGAGRPAIKIVGSDDVIVEFNTIDGCLGAFVIVSDEASGSRVAFRTLIRKNIAFNVCKNDFDTGAFYQLGRSNTPATATDIRYNWLELFLNPNNPLWNNGIYFDDATNGVTAFGNVIIGTRIGGCFLNHGGHDNIMENNIGLMVEGSTPSSTSPHPLADVYFLVNQGVSDNPSPGMINNVVKKNIMLSVDANRNIVNFAATTAANDWVAEFSTGLTGYALPTMDLNTKHSNVANYTGETNPDNTNPNFANVPAKNFFLSSLPSTGFQHIPGVTDTNSAGPPSSWGVGGYNRANY